MNKRYVEKELLKVIDPYDYYGKGKISYWAVSSNVADNMLNTDYSTMSIPELSKIEIIYMGTVQVEQLVAQLPPMSLFD